MSLRLFAIIATIALAAAEGRAQAPPAGPTQVTLQSGTYADFRQLMAREAPTGTVAVRATLQFPDEARDRYPVVVMVHTIAGYLDSNEGQHAAGLRKAGFATLTYDSFAARGTTGIALARSGPGVWSSGVADAFAALRLLADHPRIDTARIAIVGFSFGGEIAHLAAFERIRAALAPGTVRFAAHVATYPAGVFGAIAEQGAYTGSPIDMQLGGKDDNLPVAKIEGYLAYAKAAGYPAPIETMIYPDAYHAWTVPGLTRLRFYPEYPSTKKCPLILLGPGRPELLVDGQPRPFDPGTYGACLNSAPGYSMVYDAAAQTKSSTDAMAFLTQHLRP